jgi:hypothetical protein
MDPLRDLVMIGIGFLFSLFLSRVWPQKEKKHEVQAELRGNVKEDTVSVYLYKTSALLHTKACSKAGVNIHEHWTDEK